MPHGKKAASKTPMDAYVDGCRATSISTGHPTRKSRRSSSRPTSRPANASGSRRHSKPCLPSLERTFKSASLNRVALRSGIQGHPEFAEALRFRDEHGTFADDRVKRSLLHKATGYSFHSEKVFTHLVTDAAGKSKVEVTRVPVIEHIPPSDTSMIFYLKNRLPLEFSDRKELDVRTRQFVPAITDTDSHARALAKFRAVLDGASIADAEHPATFLIEGETATDADRHDSTEGKTDGD